MMWVLIVDDEPSMRKLLREWVEIEEPTVMEAASAAEAMAVIAAHGAPATAICDIHLPGQDGFWLAERLRAEFPLTAVITATSSSDLKFALGSMHAGAVDHLVYPITLERLAGALTRARLAHLSRRVVGDMQKEVDLRRNELTAALEELEVTSQRALEAMLVLRRPYEPDALPKARRISSLAVNLAMMLRIGESQLSAIERAVFLEASTTLPTPSELRSLELLTKVPLLAPAIDIARAVHERYDGNGFPSGLREDEIPLSARIIAVAVAYDDLAYGVAREEGAPVNVAEMFGGESASRFDPAVLEALRDLVSTSPTLLVAEDAHAGSRPARAAVVKEDPRRRWMRKRLAAAVAAEVGGRPARVVEISYGGCRVETAESFKPAPEEPFSLNIPEYSIRAAGTWRWIAPTGTSGPHWCGAAVSDRDMRSGSRWRALVDALPKEALPPAPEWN
jgi:putative two-component system response regulator